MINEKKYWSRSRDPNEAQISLFVFLAHFALALVAILRNNQVHVKLRV